MTCAHVLGLFDAGPFADYPRAHLDAAWQHARQCATCGPALEAATALTVDLAALAQLAPPPDMTGAVLARVARIEQARSAAAEETPATGTVLERAGWSVWVTMLGGLVAGTAVLLAMLPGDWAPFYIAPVSIGEMRGGLFAMPPLTIWTVVLAAGLGLYVGGLFAPLGRSDRL